MAKTTKEDEVRPIIIIKKVKKIAGGHHGGAWKVAYADFVTAMMAFFLLLWLLNVVTAQALQTISNYFDPTPRKISDTMSGAGGLMGGTTVSPVGAMSSTVQPLTQPAPTGGAGQSHKPTAERAPEMMNQNVAKRLETELKEQEKANFQKAKGELEKEMQQNPELKDLSKNLMVDITPEGLRIQLVDQDNKPMFPLGSAEMYGYTKKIVQTVAKVVNGMPNDISIRGHTDSAQYAAGAHYTNWELSADRANASRRELLTDGVEDKRLVNVMGKADREPLNASDAADPRNRRISIVLMNETLQHAAARGAFGDVFKPADTPAPAPETPPAQEKPYKPNPGTVYFP
jgi:chemotaxis protein MotB